MSYINQAINRNLNGQNLYTQTNANPQNGSIMYRQPNGNTHQTMVDNQTNNRGGNNILSNNGNNNNNNNNNGNGNGTGNNKPDGKATYQLPNGVNNEGELNEFFMFRYRVEPCLMKRNCPSKATCSGWHHEQERRRNPKSDDGDYRYSEEPCPAVRNTANNSKQKWNPPSVCQNGDSCSFTHTLMEQMYHPNIYKTSMCHNFQSPTGNHCQWGYYCTHAHGSDDIRNPNKKFQNQTMNQKVKNRPDRANSFSGTGASNTGTQSLATWRAGVHNATANRMSQFVTKTLVAQPQNPAQSQNPVQSRQQVPNTNPYLQAPDTTATQSQHTQSPSRGGGQYGNMYDMYYSTHPSHPRMTAGSTGGTIGNKNSINTTNNGYTPIVTYETTLPYPTRGRLQSRSDPPPYFNPQRSYYTNQTANIMETTELNSDTTQQADGIATNGGVAMVARTHSHTHTNEDGDDGPSGRNTTHTSEVHTPQSHNSQSHSHSHSQSRQSGINNINNNNSNSNDKHLLLPNQMTSGIYGSNPNNRPRTPPAHVFHAQTSNTGSGGGAGGSGTHTQSELHRKRASSHNPRTDAYPGVIFQSPHTTRQGPPPPQLTQQQQQRAQIPQPPAQQQQQQQQQYTNLTTYYDNNMYRGQHAQPKARHYSNSMTVGHPNRGPHAALHHLPHPQGHSIFGESSIWARHTNKPRHTQFLDNLQNSTDMGSTVSSQSNWTGLGALPDSSNMDYYLGGGDPMNPIGGTGGGGVVSSPPPDRPKSLPGTPHPPSMPANAPGLGVIQQRNDSKKNVLASRNKSNNSSISNNSNSKASSNESSVKNGNIMIDENGKTLNPTAAEFVANNNNNSGQPQDINKQISMLEAQIKQLQLKLDGSNSVQDDSAGGSASETSGTGGAGAEEGKDEESINQNSVNSVELAKRSQRLSDILLCKVCGKEKNDRIYCLNPCGEVVCGDCARDHQNNLSECSICHERFDNIIRLKV